MMLGGRLDISAWRARVPFWLGLAAIVVLSWFALGRMKAGMTDGGMGGSAVLHGSTIMNMTDRGLTSRFLHELVPAFGMWSIMMMAMMLPSAAPAIATYGVVAQRRAPDADATLPTALFATGYAAAWIGFSVLAAVGQISLAHASLLSPMLQSTSIAFSAAVLVAAGLFQFTGLKDACLAHCRTPLAFFIAEWRDGKAGAILLGLHHGRYCAGCCWALMAVMFVVGAMNLIYMAALAAFIMIEKLAPERWPISQVSGAILVLWGGWIAIGAWS
jgi:predicted metal-binding membrane protein